MTYKITIERLDEVQRVKQEWQQVADSGNKKDGGAVYEYVPRDLIGIERAVVFEQTVESLDLWAVIQAVNSP